MSDEAMERAWKAYISDDDGPLRYGNDFRAGWKAAVADLARLRGLLESDEGREIAAKAMAEVMDAGGFMDLGWQPYMRDARPLARAALDAILAAAGSDDG